MKTPAPIHIDHALADPGTDKRLDILRLVGECGSISEAARRAGVSYKAGWQAVDTLSNLAGTDLVERAVGGAGGGGARLTEAGHQLLQAAGQLAQARRQVLGQYDSKRRGALAPGALPALALRTSMRNQLPCEVRALKNVGGLVVVRLAIGGSEDIESRITRESAQLLGLKKGTPALALFKATAVTLSAPDAAPATGNRLTGHITRAGRSAAGAEMALQLPGGASVVGFAPAGSGLKKGSTASAGFDAASVVVALAG